MRKNTEYKLKVIKKKRVLIKTKFKKKRKKIKFK